MTRVVITKAIDTMSIARAEKADQVNAMFNRIASNSLHTDGAHASKRAIAKAVAGGGDPTAEFEAEATARGITPAALAALILSKTDSLAARELARQQMMLKIDAAASLDDLKAVLPTPPG